MRMSLIKVAMAIVLAGTASARASSPFVPPPPACEPFMPSGISPEVTDAMIASLAKTAEDNKNPNCARELRQLQTLQAKMDEYRKAGNQISLDDKVRQVNLLEGSFEATQQILKDCGEEAESLQMVQASLDLTGIALFGVLQNNPGAWLVAAGVDVVRRLGAVLQGLFTWETLEQRGAKRVSQAKLKQQQNSQMQAKMCLYVNYLDAVAALEDRSRQEWRKSECGELDKFGVCSSCVSLERDIEQVKSRIVADTEKDAESKNCALLRWEIAGGTPPAQDELAGIFSKPRTVSRAPAVITGARSSLSSTMNDVIEAIRRQNPGFKGMSEWDRLQQKALDSSASCKELAIQWGEFVERWKKQFSQDNYVYYKGLRQSIDDFEKRKNIDSEEVSREVSHLLLNIQFADYAKVKAEVLGEWADKLAKVTALVEKPVPGQKFSCPYLASVVANARASIRDMETPVNTCRVLTSRSMDSNGGILFGDRANPIRQSNEMMVTTKLDGSERLEVSCRSLDEGVRTMARNYVSFERQADRVKGLCGNGYSFEWPNSFRAPSSY